MVCWVASAVYSARSLSSHHYMIHKLSTSRQSLYLWTLVALLYQLVLIQLVYQLLLVSPSCTPLGRDLDSTSHHSHMLHCDMMEQVLVADTGRICLSSLQYCCMPPQSLHWPEWEELHSQQYWLEKKKKYWMILHVEISSCLETVLDVVWCWKGR